MLVLVVNPLHSRSRSVLSCCDATYMMFFERVMTSIFPFKLNKLIDLTLMEYLCIV